MKKVILKLKAIMEMTTRGARKRPVLVGMERDMAK
jgi:hypothetical protein